LNELTEALHHIDPAALTYQEWVSVGMALKREGEELSVWDEWSRSDSRYHPGECERKWETFGDCDSPVTKGTIFQMAMERGWHSGRELLWEDAIADDGSPSDSPAAPQEQLIAYLQALFQPDEKVAYSVRSYEIDGRMVPERGHYDRTAGQLIEALKHCGGDIGAVLGDSDPAVGAWIRFNPVDGAGVSDKNITAYRYALVESDDMPLPEQRDKLRELNLPIAALVYSGKKSLHAIVKVHAKDESEYRQRVQMLYQACEAAGLKVDKNNKNPSRLSRLPGVRRGDKWQTLIGTNLGAPDFENWALEAEQDDLPEVERLSDIWDSLPPLSPVLIDGVLRQGHKMMIAGPSKAGKTFLLIELAWAIASGGAWIGQYCRQGKVLYINLEVDAASCDHRFKTVARRMKVPREAVQNVHVWNLRGHNETLAGLLPPLLRRCRNERYAAIIIDPAYKINAGDENSAAEVAKFCNMIDQISRETGASMIYCHHHSKGAQGRKNSMDRASGSGVFARDADALIDLLEVTVSNHRRAQLENSMVCDLCNLYLFAAGAPLSLSERYDEPIAKMRAENTLPPEKWQELCGKIAEVRKRAESMTLWKVSSTLREFPSLPPTRIWFDYPAHMADVTGALTGEMDEEDEDTPPKSKPSQPIDRKTEFTEAVESANFGEPPTALQMMESLNISRATFTRRCKEYGYCVRDGVVISVEEADVTVDAAPTVAEPPAPKRDKAAEFAEAVEKANGGDPPTVEQVMEYLGVSQRTVFNRIKQYGYCVSNNTILKAKPNV
jgi:RecA-family ATPase